MEKTIQFWAMGPLSKPWDPKLQGIPSQGPPAPDSCFANQSRRICAAKSDLADDSSRCPVDSCLSDDPAPMNSMDFQVSNFLSGEC